MCALAKYLLLMPRTFGVTALQSSCFTTNNDEIYEEALVAYDCT